VRIALNGNEKNPKKMSNEHLHVIFDDVVLNPSKPASDFALLKRN
jgi:hypothetical protein